MSDQDLHPRRRRRDQGVRGTWSYYRRDVFQFATTLLVLWALVQGHDIAAKANSQATEARGSLCALRGDVERRVQSGTDFLREHPAGIPGISAATIKTNIANQQSTIRALSRLDCAKSQ